MSCRATNLNVLTLEQIPLQAKEFGIKSRTACENAVSADDEAMNNVVEFLKAVERSM